MLKRITATGLSTIFAAVCLSMGDPDKRISRMEYIQIWKEEAIHQMNKYGIPASITLAQGILESGDGNSRLARKANNHFGIKCHDWTGKRIYEDDDRRDECFRKYESAGESYEDHSLFLANRSRYAFLFDLDITDYKGWARGLKRAGYATNPRYPQLLIRIIEENNLARYDQRYTGEELVDEISPATTETSSTSKASLLKNRKYYISDNKINFIQVKPGDTYTIIQEVYEVSRRQIVRYNDLEKGHELKAGEKLYIQPKRNRAKRFESHVVEKGESLWDISQRYGVKMDKILQHNELSSAGQIEPGMRLNLR